MTQITETGFVVGEVYDMEGLVCVTIQAYDAETGEPYPETQPLEE
ncbi:hypothetical protein [Haloarcula rara]|nr:hypothetical protein [Halomicroarcula sp. SHR3]